MTPSLDSNGILVCNYFVLACNETNICNLLSILGVDDGTFDVDNGIDGGVDDITDDGSLFFLLLRLILVFDGLGVFITNGNFVDSINSSNIDFLTYCSFNAFHLVLRLVLSAYNLLFSKLLTISSHSALLKLGNCSRHYAHNCSKGFII